VPPYLFTYFLPKIRAHLHIYPKFVPTYIFTYFFHNIFKIGASLHIYLFFSAKIKPHPFLASRRFPPEIRAEIHPNLLIGASLHIYLFFWPPKFVQTYLFTHFHLEIGATLSIYLF